MNALDKMDEAPPMTKEAWVKEHEAAQEDFACLLINEDEFRARLRDLGFHHEPEIQAEIDCLMDDRLRNSIDRKEGIYA